jgi:uncharacterized membrane protein
MQGLLFIAPVGITLFVIFKVFAVADGFTRADLKTFFHIDIPGMGILVIIILLILLGFIGQSIIFSPMRDLIDSLMKRAPVIKLIYTSLNDFLNAFVGEKRKFTRPVLVKVNHISNLEKLGFLTQEDLSELKIKDKVAVYFPHSYNFSGELFIVPAEHVTPLDLPPAEVMKFIVTGGVTRV